MAISTHRSATMHSNLDPSEHRFVTPIPNKRALRQYHPSPIERLPREIRDIIYGYLGFPVGAYATEQDCSCNDCWLVKIKLAREKAEAEATDEELQDPDWRKKDLDLLPIKFNHRMRRSVIVIREDTWYRDRQWMFSIKKWNDKKEYWPDWYGNFNHESWQWQLLHVNRFFRAEILDLVFYDRLVRLECGLSEKSIFYDNWKNSCNIGGRGYFRSMVLAPSFFGHITHISLDPKMGQSYTQEMPHRLRVCVRQKGRRLLGQATSVRFIARHCPNLRYISIKPPMPGYRWDLSQRLHFQPSIKQKHVEPLVLALTELSRNCLKLESIAIHSVTKTFQRSWPDDDLFSSPYSSPARPDDIHFGPIAKFLYEVLAASAQLSGGAEIHLGGVPGYQREDSVEEWARARLTDMRLFGINQFDLYTASPAVTNSRKNS